MPLSYTREQMIQHIKEGRSLLHGGKVISRIEDLPSEYELVQGDPAAEQQALATIRAQQQQLDMQEEQLLRARRERERQAPPVKPPEDSSADADKAAVAKAREEAEAQAKVDADKAEEAQTSKQPPAFGPQPIASQGIQSEAPKESPKADKGGRR